MGVSLNPNARLEHTPSPSLTFPISFTVWARVDTDLNDFTTLVYSGTTFATRNLILALGTDGVTPHVFDHNFDGDIVGSAMTVSVWYFFMVTANTGAGNLKLYQAAEGGTLALADSATYDGTSYLGQRFWIGGRPDNIFPSDISVRYQRLWISSELTLVEGQAEMASATPVRTTNLYEHWPLDDAATAASGAVNGQNFTANAGTGSFADTDDPDLGGGTVIEGAGVLTGGGSLTGSGVRTVLGSAALTGGGALAAAGQRTVEGDAALTGGGALAAPGTRTVSGTAQLAGGGSFAASAVRVVPGLAVLLGGGQLIGNGTRTVHGTGALSGGGTLAASGTVEGLVTGSGTLAGGGALAASGMRPVVGGAQLSGGGSLTAAGTRTVPGLAELVGGGTLTGSGRRIVPGSGTLDSGGTVAGLGLRAVHSSAVIAGGGTLTAAGVVEGQVTGTGLLTGGGTLAASGLRAVHGTAVLAGGGALVADGTRIVVGVGVAAGGGALVAIGVTAESYRRVVTAPLGPWPDGSITPDDPGAGLASSHTAQPHTAGVVDDSPTPAAGQLITR